MFYMSLETGLRTYMQIKLRLTDKLLKKHWFVLLETVFFCGILCLNQPLFSVITTPYQNVFSGAVALGKNEWFKHSKFVLKFNIIFWNPFHFQANCEV